MGIRNSEIWYFDDVSKILLDNFFTKTFFTTIFLESILLNYIWNFQIIHMEETYISHWANNRFFEKNKNKLLLTYQQLWQQWLWRVNFGPYSNCDLWSVNPKHQCHACLIPLRITAFVQIQFLQTIFFQFIEYL